MNVVQGVFLAMGAIGAAMVPYSIKRGRVLFNFGWVERDDSPELFVAGVGTYISFIIVGLIALISLAF